MNNFEAHSAFKNGLDFLEKIKFRNNGIRAAFEEMNKVFLAKNDSINIKDIYELINDSEDGLNKLGRIYKLIEYYAAIMEVIERTKDQSEGHHMIDHTPIETMARKEELDKEYADILLDS